MSIARLVEYQSLDSIEDLKLVSSAGTGKNIRSNGDIRYVKTINSYVGTIGVGFYNIAYQYFENLDLTEFAPGIIKPDDNIGNWIMVSKPLFLANAYPTLAPELPNSQLAVKLTSPNRNIVMETSFLSDPPVLTDWKQALLIDIDSDPTFAPDFPGEIVRNTTTNVKFLGDGNTADPSSWLPMSVINGDPITASRSITLGDRNRIFSSSDDYTLTLPGDLTKDVLLYIVIDTPGKTITLSPDGGTGATLIGNASVTDNCILSSNANIWNRLS